MAKQIRLYPENFQEISDLTDYPLDELERIFYEAKRLGQTYVFVVGPREVHIRIELGEGGRPREEGPSVRGSLSGRRLYLLRDQEEENVDHSG